MGRPFDEMIGDCPAMRGVFESIERLAPTDLNVLVLGETGTGKELVARSLHRRSRRAAGPFVAINCAALPASLVESELFGFDKGSFTGAVAAHVGHIERAQGGTLFLDEVAELPFGAQAKLLRVVQDKRVLRLGSTRERAVDMRLVAATHQDLPGMVEAGAFRRDLYHRLDEAQIVLPPLRSRDGDLEVLAEAWLARLGRELGRALRLGPAALACLHAHHWPGNVRELENALRAAAVRAAGPEITAAELPLEGAAAQPRTLAQTLELATEAAVRAALRRREGDAGRAAAELGLSPGEFRTLAGRFHIPSE
jgi:two-component system NtrC family response regulator